MAFQQVFGSGAMLKIRINHNLADNLAKADKAAFGDGRQAHANDIIEDSNMRLQAKRIKGRGAGLNPAGRFEDKSVCSFDDGWQNDEEIAPLKTTVQIEKARNIITSNNSPDLGFDRSINPYRGCEHGCIYCFARPSHSYMGLSAGVDFETQLFAKPDAAKLLEKELSKTGYKPKIIAIGTNTDPYQPIEKNWAIMREILTVLNKANHPVSIVTKSALILRDVDILSEMAQKRLVRVCISLTTLDSRLSRAMEPRAATPKRRLETIKQLHEANIPVSTLVAPVIPGLNDHEIENILEAAKAAGVHDADFVMLRLPYEVAPLFKDWLLREYPNHYRKIISILRSMRGGKDYDADWQSRMRGSGPFAELVARRFAMACQRLEIGKRRIPLSFENFEPPIKSPIQLSLF